MKYNLFDDLHEIIINYLLLNKTNTQPNQI